MPEGPSIVIAAEEMSGFVGRKVTGAGGNAQIDISRLDGTKLMEIRTWGKHLLLRFKDFTLRIHFLLFGTYRINETKDAKLRLGLTFSNGEINFYTASIKLVEGDINSHYDWSADVMLNDWDEKAALKKLNREPDMLICDALLEQDIFSGVGNIIKNEVLYRVHVHPESATGKIPGKKLKEIAGQARQYSFDFLKWKKEGTLKKHWLAHTRKVCKRCDLPMHKKYTGTKKRRSFFCTNCQELYS